MLVIGSRNSSNSVRLVEVARDCGTEAHLIDNAGEVREEWLAGQARGRHLLGRQRAREPGRRSCVDFFRARGVQDISEFDVVREDVRFMLPKPIREAVAAGLERPAAGARPRSSRVSMRTLIVSDLHLGGALRRRTCCAAPSCARRCWRRWQDVDRLVLLGDVLELRHGPPREALAAARPFFGSSAGRSPARELVVTAGNHDHAAGRAVAGARARGCRAPEPLGARAAPRARRRPRRCSRRSPSGRRRRA